MFDLEKITPFIFSTKNLRTCSLRKIAPLGDLIPLSPKEKVNLENLTFIYFFGHNF
jgi:hypothetical protein